MKRANGKRVRSRGFTQRLEERLAFAAEPIGDPLLVNDFLAGAQRAVPDTMAVASGAAGSVVVFEGRGLDDRNGVYARRFDADGAALGDSFAVNTTTTGGQHTPSVAMADDGGFVIAWAGRGIGDKSGVFFQRYDATGATVGDETLVNTTVGGVQSDPAVALQADGSIVVAWQGPVDGDAVAVGMRRFDADGVAIGDEVRVNTTTDDDQVAPAIAALGDGEFVIGWQSRHQDGSGWGLFAQRFAADGASIEGEIELASTSEGDQSGLALAAGEDDGFVAAWQTLTDASGWDVAARQFTSDGVADGDQIALADETADNQTDVAIAVADDGLWLTAWTDTAPDGAGPEVVARARDADGGTNDPIVVNSDLSGENSGRQSGAAIAIHDEAALIVWSGQSGADGSGVRLQQYELDLTDNGTPAAPQLAEIDDQSVAAGALMEVLVTATDPNPRDDLTFTLDVDNSPAGATIEQIDEGSAVVRWTPTDADQGQAVSFRVIVTDDGVTPLADTEEFTATVDGVIDLVALSQAITDSGAQFFGAGWCPVCTEQKELFEDGSQFLPFIEVTNPDRTTNQIGVDNNITSFPTWVFADGSRLEGLQSIETLMERTGVTARTADAPFLTEVPDQTLLVGSPLHVSLDGYDAQGRALTYTVESDNPDVSAEILTGNRSLRIDVAGYGDMVFELFEQRAPRPTSRVIELAEDDFYDDIIFHRIIDDFVIQGGDPTGTGGGGSTLGDFDDQFHPDLQHNRTGLLSFAKTSDDTNDSQFFITEGEDTVSLRNLDFNHSVFGVLVEGEANRAAISETATDAGDRPLIDVVMNSVDVFDDTENAVLFLKAADGATGSANITVTVEDADGVTTQRTFRLDLEADTRNARPYLEDINPVVAEVNTAAQFRLTAIDVEGDPVVFQATDASGIGATVTVDAEGLVTVIPPANFEGMMQVEVRTAASSARLNNDPDVQIVDVVFFENN